MGTMRPQRPHAFACRLHVGSEENDVARPGEITQAALRHLRIWLPRRYGKGCAALGVDLGLAPVRASVGSGLSHPSACHAALSST